MKIGITCYPTYGGSGVLATELGKILARRGSEVHFITSSLPYRLQMGFQKDIFFHEVEMHNYPLFEHSPYDLALAAKMREIFVEEGLDVLHVHYALPHAVSAFLAGSMMAPGALPLVTTLHGTDITLVGQQKSFFDITRLGINKSTVVTAVSHYLAEETKRVFKPEIAVNVLHNFVDLELFRKTNTNGRRACFADPGQVIYTHISNFRKVKRIPDVIETFDFVQKELDSVLLMVGEGPYFSTARQMVSERRLGDKVRFLGKQEDIATLLSVSDVFLFPSELESFGLAVLEAMACSLPVIASRSGGIPEVVKCGETGYLSNVGDVTSLVKNSLKLGQSAELRKKIGDAGRKRAETLFSPDIIVPQYEALYNQAIELAKMGP